MSSIKTAKNWTSIPPSFILGISRWPVVDFFSKVLLWFITSKIVSQWPSNTIAFWCICFALIKCVLVSSKLLSPAFMIYKLIITRKIYFFSKNHKIIKPAKINIKIILLFLVFVFVLIFLTSDRGAFLSISAALLKCFTASLILFVLL